MKYRFIAIVLLALPGAAQGQLPNTLDLTVRSCPAADSLLGPLPGHLRQIKARGPIQGMVFFDIGLDKKVGLYGDPYVIILVAAAEAPTPSQASPALTLYLTGDPARSAARLAYPASILLFVNKDTAIRLSADTIPSQGPPPRGFASLNLVTLLSAQELTGIALAKEARIELGHTKTRLSGDFRAALSDAYRLAVCGYASR